MGNSVGGYAVWLVIGALIGSIVAVGVQHKSRQAASLYFGTGVLGAIVAGTLFDVFGIWPSLEPFTLSLRDVVSALVGSVLLLLIVWIARSRQPGAS